MEFLKNKVATGIFAIGMALAGAVGAGTFALANAQTTSTTTPATVAGVSGQSETPRPHGHAPLGGDGIVSSISGSSIVMSEEADEGGASYTVDASKATIDAQGSTGNLSDIKVGEKVFVQGSVSGTSVVATSISVGHPGGWMHKDGAGDTDGGAASEANESASSSGTGDN